MDVLKSWFKGWLPDFRMLNVTFKHENNSKYNKIKSLWAQEKQQFSYFLQLFTKHPDIPTFRVHRPVWCLFSSHVYFCLFVKWAVDLKSGEAKHFLKFLEFSVCFWASGLMFYSELLVFLHPLLVISQWDFLLHVRRGTWLASEETKVNR